MHTIAVDATATQQLIEAQNNTIAVLTQFIKTLQAPVLTSATVEPRSSVSPLPVGGDLPTSTTPLAATGDKARIVSLEQRIERFEREAMAQLKATCILASRPSMRGSTWWISVYERSDRTRLRA